MSEYNDISELTPKEAVRLRPGMYIGAPDSNGLHHLAWEILDNAIDEGLNGHASDIYIKLSSDKKVLSIVDNGRGIPVKDKGNGTSAAEVVFTKLHAGAKFDNEAYKSSGGLHGVGATVTNFMSEFLHVYIKRQEGSFKLTFEDGEVKEKLHKTQDKFFLPSSKAGYGTSVTFKPLFRIFQGVKEFNADILRKRIKEKAVLAPSLKFTFELEGEEPEVFYYPEGLKVLWSEMVTGVTLGNVSIEEDLPLGRLHIMLGWLDDAEPSGDSIKSFVNMIPTPEGGSHESGVKASVLQMIKALENKMGSKSSSSMEDLRSNLRAIVNLTWKGELRFAGNLKNKIIQPEMEQAIVAQLKPVLEKWAMSNSAQVKEILDKMEATRYWRAAFKKANEDAKKKLGAATGGYSRSKAVLPGKLSDCSMSIPVMERELFLVEGDSAGGSAKMARNRNTQAILPLRGKVLNTEGADTEKLDKNKEITSILEALGLRPGMPKTEIQKRARYGKIILLMDADSDGHHISTLLLGFFFRHLPELIRDQRLYIAVPPLYRAVVSSKEDYWIEDDDALVKFQKKMGNKSYELSRFKGLGEMMPDSLKKTCLDPKTRRLIPITISNEGVEEDDVVTAFMGKKSDKRLEAILAVLNNGLHS